MKTATLRPWLSPAAFALALMVAGCNDDNGTDNIGTGVKPANKTANETSKTVNQATKTATETTKAAGERLADELSPIAEGFEEFANSLQRNAEDATFDVKQSIEAKMPDVKKLADSLKTRLNAGDDDAKQAARSIDEKLAALNAKLTELGTAGATATKDLKEDTADAFKTLVDNIQNGLKKLG